jgi:hypothetical protein
LLERVKQVSFRISRERRDGQGGLGSGYYVGVVDPSFDSWDARIHSPPYGFGMEDDNSSSSRRWHFKGNRCVVVVVVVCCLYVVVLFHTGVVLFYI